MPEPLNGAGLPGEQERGTGGDTGGKCGLHLFEMRTAFVLVAPPVLHPSRAAPDRLTPLPRAAR
jgi:hypothetical protein